MSEAGTLDHHGVIACPGGPLLLRGDHTVQSPDGTVYATTRPVSAMCRCGKSANLPWCDATHKLLPQARESATGASAPSDESQPRGYRIHQASPPQARHLEAVDFGHLKIVFDERVLRPREWTTAQARWGAELLKDLPQGRVLELCSGAGHIGLLAIAENRRALVSIDVNPVAAALAADNAHAAGFGHRVEVREASMDCLLHDDERFPLIIADPPWVARSQTSRFPEDPVLAIDGGEDGLDLARTCLAVAENSLSQGGTLLLQLGSLGQVAQVSSLASGRDLLRVCEIRDFVGHGVLARLDRVTQREGVHEIPVA